MQNPSMDLIQYSRSSAAYFRKNPRNQHSTEGIDCTTNNERNFRIQQTVYNLNLKHADNFEDILFVPISKQTHYKDQALTLFTEVITICLENLNKHT
jgi:hypothetical protein